MYVYILFISNENLKHCNLSSGSLTWYQSHYLKKEKENSNLASMSGSKGTKNADKEVAIATNDGDEEM